ncbi:hypothetical protein N338_08754, partial [Podiceps cristatus]
REIGRTNSIVRTLNFRKANFELFKEIVRRPPWEMVLRDRGTEPSWRIFKEVIHREQELLIPMCKKSGREGKRLVWLRREMLVKLRRKVEWHKQRKQGQASWEEYRDAAWLCRDGVRRAKAQLELNLAQDAKNNKKGFYRYINQKRKVKESVLPLLSETGKLVMADEEKAEVFNNSFASAFTGNFSLHPSRVDEWQEGDQEGKIPPTVREDKV